jgi:hypothetical protein
MAKAPSIRRDLYTDVTSRILAELERGALPWVKPWAATAGANVPCNAATNRPYSGCNVVLLWLAHGRGWPTPRFVTFKQAAEAGGSVRKGERNWPSPPRPLCKVLVDTGGGESNWSFHWRGFRYPANNSRTNELSSRARAAFGCVAIICPRRRSARKEGRLCVFLGDLTSCLFPLSFARRACSQIEKDQPSPALQDHASLSADQHS